MAANKKIVDLGWEKVSNGVYKNEKDYPGIVVKKEQFGTRKKWVVYQNDKRTSFQDGKFVEAEGDKFTSFARGYKAIAKIMGKDEKELA